MLYFFSLNVMAVSPEDADDVFYVYVSTTQGDAGLATAIGVFKGGSNGQFYASKHGNYPFDCVVS